MAGNGTPRNAHVETDVSWLTVLVPDLLASAGVHGGVFGWTFNIGRAGGTQVSGVGAPDRHGQGPEAGPSTSGVVVCYRVDDLAAKLQQLRDAGAIAGGTAQRPYGLESFWVDGQGTPLCLRQF